MTSVIAYKLRQIYSDELETGNSVGYHHKELRKFICTNSNFFAVESSDVISGLFSIYGR